jgi:hypothetical protein
MKFLTTIVRLVAGCTHASTYRERRTLHGLDVLHFVCEDCGHAVPALDRTKEEHEQAIRAGAVVPAHARPQPVRGIVRKSA